MKCYGLCVHIYILFYFRKEEGRREGKDKFLYAVIYVTLIKSLLRILSNVCIM